MGSRIAIISSSARRTRLNAKLVVTDATVKSQCADHAAVPSSLEKALQSMKVLEEIEDGESVVNIRLALELIDLHRTILGLALLCYAQVRGGNFRSSKIQGFIRIFDSKRTESGFQVFSIYRNSEGISTHFMWARIGRLGVRPQGVQGLLQNANEVQVAFCGAFLAIDAGLLKPCCTAFSGVNCMFQNPENAIRYLQSHCLGLKYRNFEPFV